jgi:hypothetical protein
MSANVRSAVRLASVFTLGLLGVACDQPDPKCSIQRGAFAATYTLLSGSGDCSMLKGEILNIGVYSPAGKSNAPADPNRVVVGIQPQSLVDHLAGAAEHMVEPNPADLGYALGEFAKSTPDGKDFCTVPSFQAPSRVRLPEVPEVPDACGPIPAQPAVDVAYEWSDLRVYTTAGAYGTQFAAKLKYTQGSCTAEYAVSAVYPVVSCVATPPDSEQSPATGDDAGALSDAFVPQGLDASSDIDAAEPLADGGEELADAAEGDAECPPEEPGEPEAPPVADDSLCQPAPGSTINPDFATRCDPDLLLCVLSKEPPSLR